DTNTKICNYINGLPYTNIIVTIHGYTSKLKKIKHLVLTSQSINTQITTEQRFIGFIIQNYFTKEILHTFRDYNPYYKNIHGMGDITTLKQDLNYQTWIDYLQEVVL
ncbi:MAG: hypothetical protein ACRCXT_05970, partial [Paraclostridium sp.]